jgi:hypothetical protein
MVDGHAGFERRVTAIMRLLAPRRRQKAAAARRRGAQAQSRPPSGHARTDGLDRTARG